MKKSMIVGSLIASCMIAILLLSSFLPIHQTSSLNSKIFSPGEPISIISSNSVTGDDVNYSGNVDLTGAIEASGTYTMSTQIFGMWALHCNFILTLPDGTITIRMICNMNTLRGRWTVLSGTGDYLNLSGGGSLVMPGIEEVLTGTVRGVN